MSYYCEICLQDFKTKKNKYSHPKSKPPRDIEK